MRYQGSEAIDEEVAVRHNTRREVEVDVEQRPSFEVVTGGGLDARARAGVSPVFLSRVKAAVATSLFVLGLFACRVALTTATVSTLQSNASIKTEIKNAQSINDDLQVERSVLSSSSRISRIATQNYGMTLSTDREVIDVSATDASSDVETDATAETTSDSSSTDATASDGDAAQTSSDAETTASVS